MKKIIFILIGVCALYFSFSHIGTTMDRNANAVKVQGVVTALMPVRSDNGTTYAPMIAFAEQESGRNYQFQSNTSANPPAYDVGDLIEVAYTPKHPENAYVDSWFGRWGAVFISGVLGVLFVGFGLILGRR